MEEGEIDFVRTNRSFGAPFFVLVRRDVLRFRRRCSFDEITKTFAGVFFKFTGVVYLGYPCKEHVVRHSQNMFLLFGSQKAPLGH